MKVTTRKTYPFRSFYKGKQRIAFYVINVVGEESAITVYSDYAKGVDALSFRKSQLEEDEFRVEEFLCRHIPKNLAETIIKYAKKDLKCKGGFSLKAYIKWRGAQQ